MPEPNISATSMYSQVGDDPAPHAQGLHQAPGHDAAHQHFPGGLHPQMHHPPPPVLVRQTVLDLAAQLWQACRIRRRQIKAQAKQDVGGVGMMSQGVPLPPSLR